MLLLSWPSHFWKHIFYPGSIKNEKQSGKNMKVYKVCAHMFEFYQFKRSPLHAASWKTNRKKIGQCVIIVSVKIQQNLWITYYSIVYFSHQCLCLRCPDSVFLLSSIVHLNVHYLVPHFKKLQILMRLHCAHTPFPTNLKQAQVLHLSSN